MLCDVCVFGVWGVQDPTDVIFYLNFSESVGNIRNLILQGLTVNSEYTYLQ